MNDTAQGPLRGIRVADMTSVLLGPWATEILGDLGADVIKVEAPGGETTRNTGPAKNKGMAAGYLAFNRNKRSLCIDLKKKAGHKAFLKILKTIDVLVHNMRPSAMTRLGLDYESVRRINPDILYCGAYGYAQNGPYADKPAYDDVIPGMLGSGLGPNPVHGKARIYAHTAGRQSGSAHPGIQHRNGTVSQGKNRPGTADRRPHVRDPDLVYHDGAYGRHPF